MTGRERFARAIGGEGVAFVPYVWSELAAFVRQPADGWWRDATTARRLLVDAASLAAADGMVVGAAADAAGAVAAGGDTGPEVLDGLAQTAEARSAFGLVEVMVASTPFAAVAALPDLRSLELELGGDDPEAGEVAEDALADLARGFLDAGADALAVIGGDPEAVRATARRASGVARYYGRPLLAACTAPAARAAWIEGDESVAVGIVGEDGRWPDLASGVVLTDGDVSGRWDAERLHAVGRRGS